MNLIEKAALVASTAHKAAGHFRKISGADYIVHPAQVAAYTRMFHHMMMDVPYVDRQNYDISVRDEMIAAAWLHDTIEDTGLDPSFIITNFDNFAVQRFVSLLTDLKDPKLNRQQRLDVYINRLNSVKDENVRVIKVADIRANFDDIVASHQQPDDSLKFTKYERFISEKTQILNSFTALQDTQFMKTLKSNMESFLLMMKHREGKLNYTWEKDRILSGTQETSIRPL